MTVDLTPEEVTFLKIALASVTLSPQSIPGNTILPTARLIIAIVDKLEAAT